MTNYSGLIKQLTSVSNKRTEVLTTRRKGNIYSTKVVSYPEGHLMSGNWADVTPRVTSTHHVAQSINHEDQNTKEEVETMNKLENKWFVLQN